MGNIKHKPILLEGSMETFDCGEVVVLQDKS